MAWLWVLGSVVLLLVLFLLSSFHISFSYDKNAKYKLRWFFLSVTSEDMKKEPEKEKKPAAVEAKGKKKAKTSYLRDLYRGEGLTGIIDIIREAAGIAQGALKYACGHLIVKKFDIDICVSGDNAADTAILYGQVCAAVYPSAGVIVSNTKCRSYDINIYPDFNEKADSRIWVEFKGRIKLFFIIKTAVVYGIRAFKLYKNRIIPSIVKGGRKSKPQNGNNSVKEAEKTAGGRSGVSSPDGNSGKK